MEIFVIVFGVFMLSVLGMSVGVLMGRQKLSGSCGGVGNIPGLKSECSCKNPCDKKKGQTNANQAPEKTEHPITFH